MNKQNRNYYKELDLLLEILSKNPKERTWYDARKIGLIIGEDIKRDNLLRKTIKNFQVINKPVNKLIWYHVKHDDHYYNADKHTATILFLKALTNENISEAEKYIELKSIVHHAPLFWYVKMIKFKYRRI